MLIQNARDVNCDVFACFTNFKNAFDKVRHRNLIEIFKEAGLDERDIHTNQRVTVRQRQDLSPEFSIKTGVRSISNGPIINNLRYADDTVLLAD